MVRISFLPALTIGSMVNVIEFQYDVGFTGVIVQHLRFFMEAATNTVSAIFTNDGEAFCFDKFLNRRTDFAQINAGFTMRSASTGFLA